ncbi:MAG: rhodanese-like domain-containing protein [Desulfatitalea sp.]|nr:rhodanese-like domain-containing protein [Desulfatitalea sp.]NNK00417.1 rhodanese-like domain-containing protein [Desulfatitalea sp.]
MKRIVRTVLICVLILGMLSCSGANKFEAEVAKEAGAVKLVREVQSGGYDLVTTEVLKKWIDENKPMVIVDTMPFESSYKAAHVPGAVPFLFPIPEMTAWDAEATGGKSQAEFASLLGPDKSKTVVIYCGFVKCTRSHNGAVWAKKMGYTDVYRFPGGIFAWKGAGFSTEAAN